MTTPTPCFDDRVLLATEHALGHEPPVERADAWYAHLARCGACRELVMRLSGLRQRLRVEQEVDAARRRRWFAIPVAALLLVAIGMFVFARGAVPPPEPPAPEAWERDWQLAERLDAEGYVSEAERLARRALAAARGRATLFQAGRITTTAGRPAEARVLLEEALAAPQQASRVVPLSDDWYVESHLGQARIQEATPEGLARGREMAEGAGAWPGVGGSQHRVMLWTQLAHVLTFRLERPAEGLAAMQRAEQENTLYRTLTSVDADGRAKPPRDCHYLLHARFHLAQGLNGDSALGREVAAVIRAEKFRTADEATSEKSAMLYRADALEYVARAELLAERRGDPADLPAARAALEEALALRDAADHPYGRSWCRAWLALHALLAGDLSTADARSTESLALARESGHRASLIRALALRLEVLLERGPEHLAAARALLDELERLGESESSRRVLLPWLRASLSADPAAVDRARRDLEDQLDSPFADVKTLAERALRALDDAGAENPSFGGLDGGVTF